MLSIEIWFIFSDKSIFYVILFVIYFRFPNYELIDNLISSIVFKFINENLKSIFIPLFWYL